MYIYIYMCVCICIIYICKCIYICVCVYMYYIYICVCVCVYLVFFFFYFDILIFIIFLFVCLFVLLFIIMCSPRLETFLRRVSDFVKIWVLFCTCIFYFCIVELWFLVKLKYRKKGEKRNFPSLMFIKKCFCWGNYLCKNSSKNFGKSSKGRFIVKFI